MPLRAELKGCRRVDAEEKARLESAIVEAVERDLGGDGPASRAYEQWVKCQVRNAQTPIEDITGSVKWESARDKALWYVLEEVNEKDRDAAFFVFHLK